MNHSFYKEIIMKTNRGYVLAEPLSGADGTISDLRVLETNDAFRQMTEAQPGTILGNTLGRLLPIADSISLDWGDFYAAVKEKRTPISKTLLISSSDRWLRVVVHVPDRIHCALFFEDVTELQSAREKEKQLNNAKSQFLAGISHDLRTPMNAIQGFTHLLENTYLDSEQLEYINQLKVSSSLMMETINGILDISKYESGNTTLNNSNFNLYNALRDVVEPYVLLGQKKGLIVDFSNNLESDTIVYSDRLKLKRILNNLISNAIKFTTSGSVQVGLHTDKSKTDALSLKITVKDTGIGIDRDSLRKIYDPFVQGQLPRDLKNSGTGLGLTIVRDFVSQIGGHIDISSHQGIGTTVTLSLLLSKAESALEPPSLKDHHILYLSDTEHPNQDLWNALEETGCQTTLITNRAMAINQLLNTDYDLCLFIGEETQRDSSYLNMLRIALETKNTPLIASEVLLAGHEHLFQESFPLRTLPSSINKAQLFKICRHLLESRKRLLHTDTHSFLHASLLVVEDSEISRALIKKMLTQSKLTFDLAATGEEALEKCRKNTYDIILMDCELPGISGYEATRLIRQMESLKTQPIIIAMTAHAMAGDEQRCIAAGMDDYLSKPVDKGTLIQNIRRWMSKNNKDFFRAQIDHFAKVSGLDHEFCEELLGDYITSAEQTIQEIQDLLKERSLKQASDLIHRLKGSSGNIRVHAVTYYLEKAEKAVSQLNTYQATEYMVRAEDFIRRMKEGA